MVGVLDIVSIWVQLILILPMGQFWMPIFPMVGLGFNYYINYMYYKLWGELDPPAPGEDDRLV